MKKLTKIITAFVVISLLLSLSCDPNAGLTMYDFDEYNKQFDPKLNTDQDYHSPVVSNPDYSNLGWNDPDNPPALYSQEVEIEFAPNADFLKKKDSELLAEMQKSFKAYLVTPRDEPASGAYVPFDYVSAPSNEISYTFVKRSGNFVTIKFPEFGKNDVYLLFKVDGTQYTFNNGQKRDLDGNGVAGEAIYDDEWSYTAIANTTPLANKDYNAYIPGNLGWTIVISNPFSGGTFTDASNPIRENVFVASIGTSSINGWTVTHDYTSAEERAKIYDMRETIAASLAGNFTLQKAAVTASGASDWGPSGIPIVWQKGDPEGTAIAERTSGFKVEEFTPEHNTAYRVIYRGKTVFETGAAYAGVKQRIRVYSNDDATGDNRHDTEFARTNSGFYRNSDTVKYDASFDGIYINVFSQDNKNQNVVIDISGIGYAADDANSVTNFYYLNQTDNFKDNFKIIVPTKGQTFSSVNALQASQNYYELKIEKAEFRRSPFLTEAIANQPAGYNFSGYDELRLVLDPSFVWDTANPPRLYFYYNDKITQANTKYTYGNAANWQFGFWKLTTSYTQGYRPNTGPAGLWPPAATQITLNSWANGNIDASGEQWFRFTATAASHYVHFNPNVMNDVWVYLYDSNENQIGSRVNLYGSTLRTQFNFLTPGETYYVYVTPFNTGNTGNYQIGVNTFFELPSPSITLLTENTWQNGNINASGEQWFSFTASASAQYIHFEEGYLDNVNVTIYNASGSQIGTTTSLYDGNYQQFTGLIASQTYYVKASNFSDTGDYKIGFNTSTYSPGITRSVTVSNPSGKFTAGTSGTVTYNVTTIGFDDGSYSVYGVNIPGGLSVSETYISIASNSGTLTIYGNPSTTGTYNTCAITLGGTYSDNFTVTIVNELTGTVNLVFDPSTGIITANVSGDNNTGNLYYTFDGVWGSTGSENETLDTEARSALGRAVSVTVTSSVETGSILSTSSLTIYKVEYTATGWIDAGFVQNPNFGEEGGEVNFDFTPAANNLYAILSLDGTILHTLGDGYPLYSYAYNYIINSNYETNGVITINVEFTNTTP